MEAKRPYPECLARLATDHAGAARVCVAKQRVRVYSTHRCMVESALHTGPTDAGAFFGSAAALPVRFEIDRIGVANLRKCAKLSGPINVALVDRRPLRLSGAVLDGVLD